MFLFNSSGLLNRSTNGGGASTPAGGGGGSKRLAQQQAQVDEVVDIMRQNVDKVLERDKNLSLLDDRADKLQHNAAQFEQHAGKLKRKFWLKNMKMMIIMGIIGTILAIVVIAWIYSKVKAVAPALPSADVTTSIPSISDELPKVAGGSMAIPGGEKLTSKRRKFRPKTTATTAPVPVSSTVAPKNEDDGSTKEADTSKAVIKRFIRTLI
ncbi:unnamed protein product [Rotaria sp. Silwood2]|nr:unnamed protein product [Rotaria sp. Silwood2]CAF2859389.1 unnamed protein product [Rotaria sp. Silwood2]CAF3141129.1 unnamed protein product [Rotaria sp. Silwood2]CAF3213717.1 unnamed protein product [Rotaria sp. Silwood2]CAF3923877.1 unnamed protein product [Rotaria sp. Silwood2]